MYALGHAQMGMGDQQHFSYVAKLKEDLWKAYRMVTEASNKKHQQNKKAYDKRLSFHSLKPGDSTVEKSWIERETQA